MNKYDIILLTILLLSYIHHVDLALDNSPDSITPQLHDAKAVQSHGMKTPHEPMTSQTLTTHEPVTSQKPVNITELEARWSTLQRIGIIAGFIIWCLATVFGNLCIIIVIILDPRLKSPSYQMYASLACADMLVGLLVLPMFGLNIYQGYWSLGYIWCDIVLAVDYLCCTASFLTLTVISCERYRAIAYPLGQQQRNRRSRISGLMFLVWLAACTAWIPAIYIIRNMTEFWEDYYCWFVVDQTYVITACVVVYYTPIILTVTFTVLIAVLIRRSFRTQATLSARQNSDTSSGGQTRTAEGVDKQTRAARMLAAVVVTFLICWLPWTIVWPVESFHPGVTPLWLYDTAVMGAYVNSTINPVIYVFSNNKFREAIKSLLECRVKK